MKKIHVNISQTTLEAEKRRRDELDLLRSRLHLLNGKDKVLMTMYLENGSSFRQIARLAGVSDTSIARRINILTERLTDGEYITCLRNRDKFTRDQMTIAKDYFLVGLSMKEIAVKRRWSRYHVRETIIKIKSILNDCG
ncbi:MAG: hypothetical protein V3W45_05730 [Sedimentisphaerales bacterium]